MTYPDSNTLQFLETILTATREGDYQRFLMVGDNRFRHGIPEDAFKSVSISLSPRLRAGYSVAYLDILRQGHARVSLWKITFQDGGDDALLRLSVFDGKVNGVLITPAF
jgi:hypothetical protein